MTEKAVQTQIENQIIALKKATANATKSKSAANKYLIDAGIVSKKKDSTFDKKKK
jgi:hypothetical protein